METVVWGLFLRGFGLPQVTCAGILAILALGLVSAALTPIVAKVNAFFFIQSICSFSISGPANAAFGWFPC